MLFTYVRRLFLGTGDNRAKYRFTVAATVVLLILSLVGARFGAGDLWKSLDLPLWVGIILTTAGIAGFDEHGLVYASIPPYLFTLSVLLNGNFFLHPAAGSLASRQFRFALAFVLYPALFSFPLTVVGYLLGLGVRSGAGGNLFSREAPGPEN